MSNDKEIKIEVGSLWVRKKSMPKYPTHEIWECTQIELRTFEGTSLEHLNIELTSRIDGELYAVSPSLLSHYWQPYTPHPSSKAWMEDENAKP